MQLFVRGLDGASSVLELPAEAPASQLKLAVQELCGIPAPDQVLVFSSRTLQDGQSLCSQGLCQDSTVQVTARLLGGKGGFGALLRGQGRDGKITTNFDACRDLSGRRIRYQTAEEKLQKWKEEEKERELEKVAMKHLKEQAKKEKLEQQAQVDVEAVRTEQKQAVEQVQDAVQAALAAAGTSAAGTSAAGKGAAAGKAGSKHKLESASSGSPPGPSKRPKMLAMLEAGLSDDDEDSSDDSDSDADADADADAEPQKLKK